VSDHEIVVVPDRTSPTGEACVTCTRPVATYAGRVQHRRGTPHVPGAVESTGKRPSRAAVIASMPGRLAAVEERLEDLFAAQAAVGAQIDELSADIRAWTSRQPVYVEMRPAHHRVADGGSGGRRETRQLRKVANG
jgi:hypothetical protein